MLDSSLPRPRTRAAGHGKRYAGRPAAVITRKWTCRWNLRRRRWHQGADVCETLARHARGGDRSTQPVRDPVGLFWRDAARRPGGLAADLRPPPARPATPTAARRRCRAGPAGPAGPIRAFSRRRDRCPALLRGGFPLRGDFQGHGTHPIHGGVRIYRDRCDDAAAAGHGDAGWTLCPDPAGQTGRFGGRSGLRGGSGQSWGTRITAQAGSSKTFAGGRQTRRPQPHRGGRPRAGTRADRPGQRLPAHPQHRFIGLTSDLRARCITVRSGSSKDLFPNGPWLEHSSLNSRIRAALASLQAACGHGFEHAPVLFGGPWNDDGAGRPEQGGHPFAGPGPEQPPRGARTGPRPGDPGTYSLVASRTSRLGAVTVGSPIADLHCSPPPLPCVSPLEGPNPESACRFPAAALIWPFHCPGRPVPLPRDLWP